MFTKPKAFSLVCYALCLLTPIAFFSQVDTSSNKRPNIIFILADDLGWADLPVYGNQFNEAPNLDQLATEGMRFTNAYAASAVCSPTRASIQSGQYPARVGITDFITGHWRPYEEVIVPINRTQYLPEEIVTLAETLKTVQYKTAYFGKWHLGWGENYSPGQQGYDTWRVHRSGTLYNLKSKNAIYPEDENLNDSIRLSELLTDYSIDFIEKNKASPFFLFLSHFDVHVQLDADRDLIDKYLKKEAATPYPSNAVYAAMIEHIDRSVGRIMNKLKELELEENTLVIFYSDNGGLIYRYDKKRLLAPAQNNLYKNSELQFMASSNYPLKGEKGTLYEGGIREPLIVRWPAQIKPGSTNHDLVSSPDFYQTILDITGALSPENQVLDGISLLPSFKEEAVQSDRALYWHYPVYHHSEPASAVRKGNWKLIENLVNQEIRLYNLDAELSESKDLSKEFPKKTEELRSLLKSWQVDVNAQMPVKNPSFDASKRSQWGRHPSRDN